jgi:hypothetical protein
MRERYEGIVYGLQFFEEKREFFGEIWKFLWDAIFCGKFFAFFFAGAIFCKFFFVKRNFFPGSIFFKSK